MKLKEKNELSRKFYKKNYNALNKDEKITIDIYIKELESFNKTINKFNRNQ